jgi:regulator of protease activity HflC (stomatin/prohibitin superfamily)
MQNTIPTQVKLLVGLVLGILGITLLIALAPFTIVEPGEASVITNLGKVDRVLDPGIHWVTPLTESVNTFDVQTQKETVNTAASSKDLQDVNASIAVTYNLNRTGLGDLYKTVGTDYASKIIDPSLQEGIKAATAKYTAEELITKRSIVTDEILTNVKLGVDERTEGDYLTITAIAIIDFKFSESFNSSIEAKVKAEQDALTAKNKLEQVKYEAAQTVASAQAQAESIRIQAAAINATGGKDYVALQWIEAWKTGGSKVPTYMMNGNEQFLMQLPN